MAIAGLAAVILIVVFSVIQSRKGVVKVQTARVQRAAISAVVTASGEIRPKNYVNIGADAFGKIIKLYVKEGDRVRKGQMLAQIENVQPRLRRGSKPGRAGRLQDRLRSRGRQPRRLRSRFRTGQGGPGTRPARLGTGARTLPGTTDRQAGLRHQEGHLRLGERKPGVGRRRRCGRPRLKPNPPPST